MTQIWLSTVSIIKSTSWVDVNVVILEHQMLSDKIKKNDLIKFENVSSGQNWSRVHCHDYCIEPRWMQVLDMGRVGSTWGTSALHGARRLDMGHVGSTWGVSARHGACRLYMGHVGSTWGVSARHGARRLDMGRVGSTWGVSALHGACRVQFYFGCVSFIPVMLTMSWVHLKPSIVG